MNALTTGIELELWVVDESGRLSDGTGIVDAHRRIEPEFIDPLIEVKTGAHAGEHDLRRDLLSTLRAAIRAGESVGKRLVPLGTPLTESDVPANCERGRAFEEVYGPGVRSAKNCAGTHVHFQQDGIVDQINLLTALDPALALVSSSPYYAGRRGASSARALTYRRRCGDDFRPFTELWDYADSVAGWRARVDKTYDRFKRLAADRGVSTGTVEALFEPENTVLNPVRLRECQPTVEWRAPDATLPSQILRLAADVGSLVSYARTATVERGPPSVHHDRIRIPEFDALRDLSRQAIRSGLDSPEVRSYLRTLGFDPSAYDPLSPRLAGPRELSDAEARALRLRQADRLRADVGMTRETAGPASPPGPGRQ